MVLRHAERVGGDRFVTAHDWEPGDPLHERSGYGGYFYNWRPDLPEDLEYCRCPDRARWPEPDVWGQKITEDPLGPFIKDYHDWKAKQGG